MALPGFRSGRPRRRAFVPAPQVEGLEARAMLDASAGHTQVHVAAVPGLVAADPSGTETLKATEVAALLRRAAAATPSDDGIVAVVDRGGHILGVRVEANVSPAITSDPAKLTFAIDGAVAEARTAAFFANNTAPLTSRTIQDISQSTITQREVESSPNILDPNSALRGPGFVAPVGFKAHFPPGIRFTPQVDLFQIEHTNRDSIIHPGADHLRGTPDDIRLRSRFNADPRFILPGKQIDPPESYGFVSGLFPNAQSRGIGTLPGGIPLIRRKVQPGGLDVLIGGIGVFFPGTTGFATAENSNLNEKIFDPTRPDRAQEAELVAFAAAGGSFGAGKRVGALGGVAPLTNVDIPFGRIDLVGISLDIVGGHGLMGPSHVAELARQLHVGTGNPNSGVDLPVTTVAPPSGDRAHLDGQPLPDGWLVLPHDSTDGKLKAADVATIITHGINQANVVRAAIRLPLDRTTRMVLSVTDTNGEVLGLYRMPDATFFSIDVAVAKARNVTYYADPNLLQPIDKLPGIPAGTAFTNRTFRYLSQPRFPEAIDGYPPGPFSILNETSVLSNATLIPASAFQTVQGFDSFNVGTNFHDPKNIANQNGIVFFPGSVPLYKDLTGTGGRALVGGFGVSGDGVDQDDVVTDAGKRGFEQVLPVKRADEFKFRGVRLPYQKFNRQPHEQLNGPIQNEPHITPKPGIERAPANPILNRGTNP